MNKDGFTLVELLAVLVLIALISLISYPSIQKLMSSNAEKEYTNYEKLMIYYTKALPLNKYVNESGNGNVCLSTLKMKKINEHIDCNGFVKISGNTFTPYLVCTQDGKQVWKTKIDNSDSWTLPSEC